MTANELRIGNRILNDGVKNVVVGIADTKKVLLRTLQGNNISAWIELIQPIPLTEEWLFRFGFEKKENEFHLNEGYYIIFQISENEFLFTVFEWKQGKAIHTVHQLQNLYYALTGEELTVNQTATV